jgi:hypothetical protein
MNPTKKRIRTEDTNPGPGALSFVRIPTTSIIDHKNNKEHTINSETTSTLS